MQDFEKLAEKKRLSAADRQVIAQAADEYGISLNKACSNCYHDAAVLIALKLRKAAKHEELNRVAEADKMMRLKEGVDITIYSYKYGTLHVCNKLCNPANVKLWIAAGVPMQFFENEGNE